MQMKFIAKEVKLTTFPTLEERIMEIEHKRTGVEPGAYLGKVLVTEDMLRCYIEEFYSNDSDLRRYRKAYSTALHAACIALRSINRKRAEQGTLTAMDILALINRNVPETKWVGLEARIYQTLTSFNGRQPTYVLAQTSNVVGPTRLTDIEVFIYSRLFELQDSWNNKVGSKNAKRFLEDALRYSDGQLATVTWSFFQVDIVEAEVVSREDGSTGFVNSNIAIDRGAFETLKKYPHWLDFVCASYTSILVVG